MDEKIEHCCLCDEPTGRAGILDDSLYLENGQGPLCENCYMNMEKKTINNNQGKQ